MRVFAVALALSVLLAASETFAQAPAPAGPPGRRPARQPPARGPSPRAGGGSGPAPAAAKFQDGLKYAYIRIQRIAAESGEGKALNERVKALNDQKVRELNEKNKALQTAQQKLERAAAC